MVEVPQDPADPDQPKKEWLTEDPVATAFVSDRAGSGYRWAVRYRPEHLASPRTDPEEVMVPSVHKHLLIAEVWNRCAQIQEPRVPWATFLAARTRWAVLDIFATRSSFGMSRSRRIQELLTKPAALTAGLARPATIAELADALNVPVTNIETGEWMISIEREHVPFDEVTTHEAAAADYWAR